MNSFFDLLSKRFLDFVLNILKIENELCRTYSGRHIYTQLFRSGTSAGANYEEARAGESKADFIHKMQIVLKELRESSYWILLINASNQISYENNTLSSLLQESKELTSIIAKSIVTAKTRQKKSN
jgi:four helix bundle protein